MGVEWCWGADRFISATSSSIIQNFHSNLRHKGPKIVLVSAADGVGGVWLEWD